MGTYGNILHKCGIMTLLKGCDTMQKEININELETTINSIDEIKEPIIVKRDNKQDLVIISLEEYEKNMFFNELTIKLEQGEEEFKNGKIHDARTVFKELRQKYGY